MLALGLGWFDLKACARVAYVLPYQFLALMSTWLRSSIRMTYGEPFSAARCKAVLPPWIVFALMSHLESIRILTHLEGVYNVRMVFVRGVAQR